MSPGLLTLNSVPREGGEDTVKIRNVMVPGRGGGEGHLHGFSVCSLLIRKECYSE